MKKILIAPNAFKGTLTALEAARCIERGLKKSLPRAKFILVPMADGGDGTVRAIVDATGGRIVTSYVNDPLGRKIKARWGLSGDGATAVIEMATASGLALLKPDERDPRRTSTFGTGELIRAALSRSANKLKRIVIGIGGSATNDAGMGMARALGVKLLDAAGAELQGIGDDLIKLARIDSAGLDPRLRGIQIDVACDVDNPLYGTRGAAHIYGPQKGASPEVVKQLDDGLRNFAKIAKHDLHADVARLHGAGAAGGMGGGLVAFLKAHLRPGAEIVSDAVALAEKMRGCDFVVTGEGRLDGQTASGKAPAGVARVAKKMGIPVIAICGSLGENAPRVNALGIDAFFSALETPLDESELPRRGPKMLERCAEQVGRLLAIKLR